MTRLISLPLPDHLYEELERAALQLEQPKTWVITQALELHLDSEEMRHQMTLAGLADVDASRTVDDETMDEWMSNTFGPERIAGEDG